MTCLCVTSQQESVHAALTIQPMSEEEEDHWVGAYTHRSAAWVQA